MMDKTSKNPTPVLKLDNLSIAYKVRGGEVEAVQDVSFEIRRGESVGIVGESGCGKSTVAWSVVNFLGSNGYVKRGSIHFQGRDLTKQRGEALRRLRGDQIAMVYQDPMKALNPSLRIGEQMNEVLIVHQKISQSEAHERSIKMLKRVYMADPQDVMKRYPHQLSGGQQQRVVIATALLNNPALLIRHEDVQPILQVSGLKKYYDVMGSTFKDMLGLNPKKYVKAVEDASFEVIPGKTLGIVGESGCGKSTLIKTIIGLEESTGGKVDFLGLDINKPLKERTGEVLKELQMVFQNPNLTMNPSYTVGQQIARPMKKFGVVPKNEVRKEVVNFSEVCAWEKIIMIACPTN